jgi:MerR family transcriptional regulator, light-induced transcriptional regulator
MSSDPQNEQPDDPGVSAGSYRQDRDGGQNTGRDRGRELGRDSGRDAGRDTGTGLPELVLRIPRRPRPPLEREQLDMLIQGEIIPRLMMALGTHKADDEIDRSMPPPSIDRAAVAAFAALMRRQDTTAADAYVNNLRTSGVLLDQIYLELMAPAARALGEMWDDDKADFVEVTLALSRLQRMVQAHMGEPLGAKDVESLAPSRYSILLAPTPGETHTFGLTLLGEYFRQGGWDTVIDPGLKRDNLVKLVKQNAFDVVGLTLAHERLIPVLSATIVDLRRAAGDRPMVVMVGGAMFAEKVCTIVDVNADGWAVDARSAVRTATRLISEKAEPRHV